MISCINGELEYVGSNKVSIATENVSFDVFVSSNDIKKLPHIGEKIRLYTYMNVREDEISLYGFLNRKEKDIFIKLINVNGVGPKGAQNIIGFLGLDALTKAISDRDVDFISSVQGIGKKTASKICIELSDKMDKKIFKDENAELREEVIEALKKLGYKENKAREMLARVDIPDDITTGELLKLVLR